MKESMVQLDDLPNEILLIIFKNMCKAELLYSLTGVNQRLNAVAHDPIFTNHLTLLRHSLDGCIYPLTDSMLDRFCCPILPSIHDKIKWLDLESSSMERILLTTNYSNLYRLGLYNIDIETARHFFTGESALTGLFKNKILSLIINTTMNGKLGRRKDINTFIFTSILTMFTNLQYLNFISSLIWYQMISFNISPPSVISSNLLELYVSVGHFADCLYFLDGRFSQLRTLHINISLILYSWVPINNKENLPNLKDFSLYCNDETSGYHELIVPLLHRMLNLEKLGLYFLVYGANTFVDGNDLKKNIVNKMARLNKFQFNIRSTIRLNNEINLPSNEDIQHTFKDFQDNHVISCVDYFSGTEQGQCHIYSYPYTLEHYENITNNFPGGLFKCVSVISLFDERPFEHEFFLRIQKSFPFLKKLTLINMKPQCDKQCRKSEDENQNLPIIEYPHLTMLNLIEAHEDYLEQFLLHTITCLSNNVCLLVLYQVLRRVTQKFTRNTTRINCAKLRSLSLQGKYRIPKYVKEYFPRTKIL
ncbi:unnamed protein product [Rotaria sp. Silwood2]|nr:unnamed protein product [Rotaria sp. Silwood2]CAF3344811.1 unnamed protein product [Rotaria sp. Silwood2]CAF4369056.1 unnamed protein product [Rotaria sp. Silwood2]CAF4529797.1 unnamed protein product [Rotaria sp. Silwood2]